MNTEYLVILAGVGVVALAWLLLRFGKQIARALLVCGGMVIVSIVAVSSLASSLASYQTARAAQTAVRAASVGSGLTGVVIGALGTVALLGGGGAVYYRVKLELERRRRDVLPREQHRRPAIPQAGDPLDVVYIEDGVDLAGLDLSQWGW